MEGISILAENVIKIEDVKEEQVIKEECNWNCIEEVESSSISCSVKRENDSDEEELERPISVFVGPNEDQERVFRGEEKDPLSFCEEAFIKQEEASCSSAHCKIFSLLMWSLSCLHNIPFMICLGFHYNCTSDMKSLNSLNLIMRALFKLNYISYNELALLALTVPMETGMDEHVLE
ncbi:Protein of unknown function, partial [Gryllus bimaculatus]